jgi:hypothetical protein
MKCYTDKENKEMLALMTLIDSDNKSIADFAKSALANIPTVSVEIIVEGEILIDARVKDNDLDIAEHIAVYNECVARSIDLTEDFAVKIEVTNLLTGEIIFYANYEVYNKGEATATSEWCSRKALREVI